MNMPGETNRSGFTSDRIYGETVKVYLDSAAKRLAVTDADDFGACDIIDAGRIRAIDTEIRGMAFHIRLKIDAAEPFEIDVDLNPDSRPADASDDLYLEQQMQLQELASTLRMWTHQPTWRDTYLGPIPGYHEAIAKKRAEFPMTPVKTEPVHIPDGCWQCFYCRTVNAGKFCEECGKPRPK